MCRDFTGLRGGEELGHHVGCVSCVQLQAPPAAFALLRNKLVSKIGCYHLFFEFIFFPYNGSFSVWVP